jgi:succinate dehydrogenase / fumarate reductase, cytochrome b subunit
MASMFDYMKSTILSKIVMAVTGLVLVLFIMGHTLGNLQLFIGKETFNTYAQFLQGLGELLWVIRIVLFLCLVFHIITSIKLKFYNLSSKPKKYQVKNYIKAKLKSRTMIWTGIMIFAFLAYHIMHFTMGITNPKDFNLHERYVNKNNFGVLSPQAIAIMKEMPDIFPKDELYKVVLERHDVYSMVIAGFKNPLISLAYIIGVILMGFHLSHAIQSMFQTLGWNNPRYFPSVIAGSDTLATLIVVALISIPITILLGLVGGVA